MKKFLVIGNPVDHSLSPKLHNYWIKKNRLDSIYGKLAVNEKELSELCDNLRQGKLDGINVTVPFKKEVIPYLDKLTPDAEATQSVNTILLDNDDKIMGHNTDIGGFENAIKFTKYDFIKKKVFLLGAGGVVPSIIFALNKMRVSSITLSNRTKKKAEDLQKFSNEKMLKKNKLSEIGVVNWGVIPEFDIVINATSVGLNNNQKLDLDFSNIGKNKFFYDVIYNPKETKFLKTGKDLGNLTENGKKMFIYQAAEAFKLWHNIQPEINEEVIELLDQ